MTLTISLVSNHEEESCQESEKVEATEEQAPEPYRRLLELDEETKEESEVQSVPIEDVSAEAEEESLKIKMN